MSEIDFLAVSAILMIISDFAWHWLLTPEKYFFMCRKKITVTERKGPKTLQGITTLYSLRQRRECGVANDMTTADCNQLFRFCAWPERKINFRYAVVVPPIVVLNYKVSFVRATTTMTWFIEHFESFTSIQFEYGKTGRILKEYWGTYHLQGKTGNFSWKIKWFAPFHLESFRKYGLWFEVMLFFCSFKFL